MKKLEEAAKALHKAKDQIDKFIQANKHLGWDELWDMEEMKALRDTEGELKRKVDFLDLREVRKYANYCMYTDVQPYEVVKVISDKTVEIRAMDTKQTKFPKDFHPGGFSGHYADNRSGQEYEYISNPEHRVERIRWSEANRQWQQGKHARFSMSDKPYKFHDYNF